MDSSGLEIKISPQNSNLAKIEEESQCPALTSVEQFATKVKRLRDAMLKDQKSNTPINASGSQVLSTECIMKLAKARLLQFDFQKTDVLSSLTESFGAQPDLLAEVSEDLKLAILLQAAAEKVANHQFVDARKLLGMCHPSASKSGNPVQRVVYYFAEALEERIDGECGIILSDKLNGKAWKAMEEELALIGVEPAISACQQDLPFCLVTQFATIESILENVGSAKRVHLIDFAIDNGALWTLIMQPLAVRNEGALELLKITAVGTSKQMMEETGKWLSSFAESIGLPFSFKIVVSDLKNLKEDLFDIEADEVVAVHLAFRLWTQLAWPNNLEALLGVITNLKPCVMVVRELEASINTKKFMERFNEALFFLSAMFDCVKASMGHQIQYRKLIEEVYLKEMIRNIITAEGTERYQRYERVTFWRALFQKFGFVETDLSHLSLCQARLLLSRSDRNSSCSLVLDGKCLVMGWIGTPLESISAWKF